MRNIAKKPKKEDVRRTTATRMKATSLKSKGSSLAHMVYSRTYARCQNYVSDVIDAMRSRLAADTPKLMKYRPLKIDNDDKVDKVFASRWINPNVIVAGTKCNKLKLIRLDTQAIHELSFIPSIDPRPPIGTVGGIHGMDIDPSNKYFATGGSHENEVNIFDVETLTPRFAGIRGHSDWIFDIRWLSDKHLVSCSRDGSLAVWSLDKYLEKQDSMDELSMNATDRYLYDTPIYQSHFWHGGVEMSLRALAYSRPANRLNVITTRKELKILDTNNEFQEVRTIKMDACCNEAVTAAVKPEDPWQTAVGSQSHINLYDLRDPAGVVKNFRSKHFSYGVRSVQFNDYILSYSTGRGSIFFYDVRNDSHLDQDGKTFSLNLHGLSHVDLSLSSSSLPFPSVAIYTHEYDHSKTRLFCGGGPLAACDVGSYAAVWW